MPQSTRPNSLARVRQILSGVPPETWKTLAWIGTVLLAILAFRTLLALAFPHVRPLR